MAKSGPKCTEELTEGASDVKYAIKIPKNTMKAALARQESPKNKAFSKKVLWYCLVYESFSDNL